MDGRLDDWLNEYNEMFTKFTLDYVIHLCKGSNREDPRDPCKGLDDSGGKGWERRV